MGIHVVILPKIGSGKSIEDARRPDFGSLKNPRWGQASSKLGDEEHAAVWVECSDAEAEALVKEVGGESIGVALDDEAAARVKEALAAEKPPRFDELRQRKVAYKERAVDFVTLVNATDDEVLAEHKALRDERLAIEVLHREVESFQRPALAEFKDAVAAVVAPLEPKESTGDVLGESDPTVIVKG